MQDRIHQPYRARVCSNLPRLLPLAGRNGILGVALSGAGPGVLVVVDSEGSLEKAIEEIRAALGNAPESELIPTRFSDEAAARFFAR